MCGIVAAAANRDVASILLEGLKRLEYRGYDSAGIALLGASDKLFKLKKKGKVDALKKAYQKKPFPAKLGIAHTRWATHGAPNETNAHPHSSHEKISVVHNGIIENHNELRNKLIKLGYSFNSDTDTEVIAHLIHHELTNAKNLMQAALIARNQLIGAFAVVIIDSHSPSSIVGIRQGSPLVVGNGIDENYLASDVHALMPVTNRFMYLEEGDVVQISRETVNIINRDGSFVARSVHEINVGVDPVERGEYRHYMEKEIYEQPSAIAATLEGRVSGNKILPQLFGPNTDKLLGITKNIMIVACGTSYHSGLVAKYWIEELAGIACRVEIASEFRYRKVVVPDRCLFITISQSGETADTLAALKAIKSQGYLASLAICNVTASSLVRESDYALFTNAGPEIGVASTKAFTTQLVALALLTCELTRVHTDNIDLCEKLVDELVHMPVLLEQALTVDQKIKKLAERFVNKHSTLFLGRGCHYPIALEGALKLKEISYIHAEAYPAGELKHGPLALIDESMPVVAIAPNGKLLEKLTSNLEEVKARGGELFVIGDVEKLSIFQSSNEKTMHLITLENTLKWFTPILMTIPLQLLAYHVAVLKGTDVDQPRNLAKSVTVE